MYGGVREIGSKYKLPGPVSEVGKGREQEIRKGRQRGKEKATHKSEEEKNKPSRNSFDARRNSGGRERPRAPLYNDLVSL